MRPFLLLVGLFLPSSVLASLHIGTGLSSSMSGRMIPGLELGVGGDSWRATASTIGVNSAYYSHTAATASFFATWKSGSFFWGEIESGLGGGLMYATRSFQDAGSLQEEKKTDFALGPAFFVQWYLVGPAYLKIDMIWGLRSVSELVGLNGQDVIFMSLGVRAW